MRFWDNLFTGCMWGLRLCGVTLVCLAYWMSGDSTRAEANAYALACSAFIWSYLFEKVRDDIRIIKKAGGGR